MKYINGILLIFIVGLSVMVALTIWSPARIQPPVVNWTKDNYEPVDGCPGDVVAYSLEMQVNEPAILFVASAVLRDGPMGDTVSGSRSGEMFVTVIPTPREIVDEDARWTIPNLPPGSYVRVVAAGTLSEPSEPAIRLQPFTIIEGCSTGG